MKSPFSSTEVALPVAAEEGFTGLLETSGSKIMEGLEDFSKDELLKIDSEGRCVITDHGHFSKLKNMLLIVNAKDCLNSVLQFSDRTYIAIGQFYSMCMGLELILRIQLEFNLSFSSSMYYR